MNTEITERAIIKPTLLVNLNRRGAFKWIVAVLPVLFCAVAARNLPAWLYMWLLAVAMFAGAKWVVTAFSVKDVPRQRVVAFLFLWPGLNAERFFFKEASPAKAGEWVAAMGKTVLGGMIIWGGLRLLPVADPMLIGWIGMIGIAFLLHFGAFHILSNVWRAAGFDAPPIMNNPIGATSLATFWGGRWNKAFHDLMGPHVFRPMAQIMGTTAATLGVFLISGLLHEIIISLPARAGFGLPTLYFTAQAGGLLTERSRLGRRCGLGRGIRGRLFTLAVTAAPAYWLFHPAFVRHVILPMLRAIGAI